MKYQMLISGYGGQGTVFLVKLISVCADKKGMNCLGTENHGMAQRGGSVVCFMKVGNVHSPLVASGRADLAIGLDPDEALRYTQYMKKTGHMVVNGSDSFPIMECNSTVVDVFKRVRQDGDVPAQAINIFLLGVTLATVKDFPFSKEEVIEAMREINPKVLDANKKVLDQGIAACK